MIRLRSTLRRFRDRSPASMRLSSDRSSTRRSRRRSWRAMMRRSCWSSSADRRPAPDSNVSTAERMPARGVRTSWEKSEMKFRRICSSRSIFVTSMNSATAAISSDGRGSARISIFRSTTPDRTEKRSIDSCPARAPSKASKICDTRTTSLSGLPTTASLTPNNSAKRRLAMAIR